MEIPGNQAQVQPFGVAAAISAEGDAEGNPEPDHPELARPEPVEGLALSLSKGRWTGTQRMSPTSHPSAVGTELKLRPTGGNPP